MGLPSHANQNNKQKKSADESINVRLKPKKKTTKKKLDSLFVFPAIERRETKKIHRSVRDL